MWRGWSPVGAQPLRRLAACGENSLLRRDGQARYLSFSRTPSNPAYDEPCGDSRAFDDPLQGRGVLELTAIKLPVRRVIDGSYAFSGCIHEVARPRYALRCFATHVETRLSPQNFHFIA